MSISIVLKDQNDVVEYFEIEMISSSRVLCSTLLDSILELCICPPIVRFCCVMEFSWMLLKAVKLGS